MTQPTPPSQKKVRSQPYRDLAAACERIDRRNTRYRFDIEADLPWDEGVGTGLHLPPRLLGDMSVDAAALRRNPAAWEMFQWAAGLEISRSFSALEQYLLDFVDAEHDVLGPTRSALLLYQEERKHVALFERYGALLRELRPEWCESFDKAFEPNVPALLHPYTEDGYEDPAVRHFFFWIKTLFFEEYTVYLDERLREESNDVSGLWLAAHRCHRLEEQQHVVTDIAHVRDLALPDAMRRACATTFWAHLEHTFELFLGVAASRRMVVAHYPEVASALPEVPTRELPLFAEIHTHRCFKGTRRCAPSSIPTAGNGVDGDSSDAIVQPSRKAHLVGTPQTVSDETLVDRLVRAAGTDRGITWISEREPDKRESYAELLERAERLLSGLREQGLEPGKHVVIRTDEPRMTVGLFWACLLGGATPVLFAAQGGEDYEARVSSVCRALPEPLIVVDRDDAAGVSAAQLEKATHKNVVHSPGGPDAIALMQPSSGSTGAPKGVLLSHRNLLANTRAIIEHLGGRRGDRFLSWLPLHHDMGLIGYHILPVVFGEDQALMRPRHFLKRPLDWLRAVARHESTVSASPTFGLALTSERVARTMRRSPTKLDGLSLGSLRTLLVGAEPIHGGTLDDFAASLDAYGFVSSALTPAYGLAESTLCVTGRRFGDPDIRVCLDQASMHEGEEAMEAQKDAVSVTCVGTILPGLELRVVAEDGSCLNEKTVGRIEVRGASVCQGYLDSSQNGEAFRHGWLQTGDLGFVLHGRLFVTGRTKDVIFVNGQKLYAHDLEEALAEVEGLHPRRICAFGSQDATTGRDLLCIAAQIRQKETAATVERLNEVIAKRFGVRPDRVLPVGANEIPRTSSGKLQRFRLRERFERGDLRVFEGPSNPEELASESEQRRLSLHALVRQCWAEALEIDLSSVGDDEDFRVLGGTSLKAAMVHTLLEDSLGKPLPHAIFFEAATVSDLVQVLADKVVDTDDVAITPERGDSEARAESAEVPLAKVLPTTEPARQRLSVVATPEPAAQVTPSRATDVAIVGIGLRFPGGASVDDFWDLLCEGKDVFEPVPAERWDHERYLRRDPTLCRTGAFVHELFDFDPGPFGLSTADAAAMEPRQRLFLEAAAVALGEAGIAPGRVGVYVSQGENPLNCWSFLDDLERGDTDMTGRLENSTNNMVAARVARAFRLTGPAVVVQAACASSAVAVHQARRAIQQGDCEVAIAGGVEVAHSPTFYTLFGPNQVLSNTGRCRPFSDHADGFVPGEGAGVVVLKSLQRAMADGDRVLCVIKGSAVTNDGESFGSMAPNPGGQIAAARAALEEAGVAPATVSMVEAHGTATPVGDAVELHAMRDVYDRPGAQVAVTSVKSNIGHLLAAAGVASIIKAALAVERGVIPPIANHEGGAARDSQPDSLVQPIGAPTSFPSGGPRRAAVNTLGIGGTNAHLVLEQAPALLAPPITNAAMCLVGARTERLLREEARLLISDLQAVEQPELGAVCASIGRRAVAAGRVRSASVVTSIGSVLSHLEALAEGTAPIARVGGRLMAVFPGPGSHAADAARALRDEPVFAQALEDCEAVIRRRMDASVDELLARASERIDEAQPAVFAVSWASWNWLCSIGVRADGVMGHSAGEYAAAAAAGILSMEHALEALIERGRAMASAPSGAMAVLNADVGEAEAMIAGTALEIAAVNAPGQTVVSGPTGDLKTLLRRANGAGIRATTLSIPCAAHSAAMESAQPRLAAALSRVRFQRARVPMYSSLTGAAMSELDAAYLVRQLRAPVSFDSAATTAIQEGFTTFCELGAAPVLSPAIQAIATRSLLRWRRWAFTVRVRGWRPPSPQSPNWPNVGRPYTWADFTTVRCGCRHRCMTRSTCHSRWLRHRPTGRVVPRRRTADPS